MNEMSMVMCSNLLGLLAFAGMVLFLIWRQAKPIPVRILHTMAVLILPVYLLLVSPARRNAVFMVQHSLENRLRHALERPEIPDEQLTAAWQGDDLWEVKCRLDQLLSETPVPPPSDQTK